MRKAICTICILVGLTAGCTTLDWANDLKDKLTNSQKPKVTWREGHHVINVDGKPADWKFSVRFGKPNMSRPNGAAERMLDLFEFTNGKYYNYFRVGRNFAIRHRAKGGTNYNYHVPGTIAPIPTGESLWEWEAKDGKLWLRIDGNLCNKYPLDMPGARLKRITLSHDAGRPAGLPWAEPTLTVGE